MPQVGRSRPILRLAVLLVVLSTGLVVAPFVSAASNTELNIWVSIQPQQWFAEQLLAGRGAVHVLLEPGESPATYDPSPKRLALLSGADLFFSVGVPFEQTLLSKLRDMHPELEIVDSRMGVSLRSMNDHGHDHGHTHGSVDPHFWLDPNAAAVMADNMAQALCHLDSTGCEGYRARLGQIKDSLATIDSTVQAMLSQFKGRRVYVYHAAFGYWCDAYGLEQVPIEVGGKQPGPRKVAELITSAREDGVRVIFVQPQFSMESAETIANELGGTVTAIDPLADDYPENLIRMAQAVRQGFMAQGATRDR
ncbi:ABC transporter substrate-binding protein [candidate division GN15 bacterium]|nr:ABC transporter substrate-binding protein [candidate division GN15 bacterium]